MRKYLKRLALVLCLVLAFCTSVSAMAQNEVSVTIYTVDPSKDSNTMVCYGTVKFEGCNSIYSDRNLTIFLRQKTGPSSYSNIASSTLPPGTGWINGTWHTISESQPVPSGGLMYVHLEPAGGATSGCYGAGRITN